MSSSTWDRSLYAQRAGASSSLAPLSHGGGGARGRAPADVLQSVNEAVRTAVHPTNDPLADIRTTLAALTARSDRYRAEDGADRVAPSSASLHELSKRTADRASGTGGAVYGGAGLDGLANTGGLSSGVGAVGGASNAGPLTSPVANTASVELFMAQNMNFDVQAQQQLLRQIQARQAQMAADISAADPSAIGGLGVYMSSSAADDGAVMSSGWGNADVDAVVSRIKADLLLEARNEVHQREKEVIREREDMLFKAAWNAYYASAADELELRRTAMRSTAPSTAGAASSSSAQPGVASTVRAYHGIHDPLHTPVSINGVGRGSGDLITFLQSGTTAAEIANGKIAAFAPIVEQYPPTQWLSFFTSYVADQAVRSGDELAPLWADVERLLEPLSRQGTAANLMSYVTSSRALLEQRCLKSLLARGLRGSAAQYATEDAAVLSDTRVLELLRRVHDCVSHPWRAIYFAMRAGRYDAACVAARDVGSRALQRALERVAAPESGDRNQLPAMPDLGALYEEKVTTEDPYRHAVLLILLAGRTGESNETVMQQVSEVASRVAVNVEDSLWLRLTMVRSIEETAKGGSVQSLSFLHRIVMDDFPDVVAAMGGNVARLASFLFHALLPSHALRTLLAHTASYVDGVHLALCFNAVDYLQCSPQETPIDLGAHLARYSTLVLLDADQRTRTTAYAGTALFSYFLKSDFLKAFEELCQNEVVCARLFGQRGAPFGSHALLLRGLDSSANARSNARRTPVVSKDLLNAMRHIADTAAAVHNPVLAIHMLLVTAYAAHKSENERVVNSALRRALQVAGPALAQAFRLPPSSPLVVALFAVAAQLLQVLQDYTADTTSTALSTNAGRGEALNGRDAPTAQEVSALKLLGIMADVYANEARGDVQSAVTNFLSLPFVPQTEEGVSRCVSEFSSASPIVVTGTNAVLPILFRAASAALEQYAQQSGVVHRHWSYDTINHSTVTDARPAMALRQTMQCVVLWVKQCCRQAGPNYQECPAEVEQFERTYLF